MKFFIVTLGCKVNQYESEFVAEQLLVSGFGLAGSISQADIVIVNSCTVTEQSNKKVRKLLRRARRENSRAILVLTGCFPQAFPLEAAALADVDIVLGNSNRRDAVNAIDEFLLHGQKIVRISAHDNENHSFESMNINRFNEQTRAIVKIQDGCDRFCAYCIIPYARGRVRSRPIDDIIAEVSALAGAGYKEVVLVGINLSMYGKDLGLDLCHAVEAVCSIDGIVRVRLGSLEPDVLDSDSIARLAACQKLCAQFHLSLQSGCDDTLKRMGRRYSTCQYMHVVESFRSAFNNAAITTDVMVGFPGETCSEFERSLQFVRQVDFAKAHVFAYSMRPGTRAASYPGHLDDHSKKLRSTEMARAVEYYRRKFFASQVGRVDSVLFEQSDSQNFTSGYTSNYTPVRVLCDKNISGEILNVRLVSPARNLSGQHVLSGVLVNNA